MTHKSLKFFVPVKTKHFIKKCIFLAKNFGKPIESFPRRLHLGCGTTRIHGWTNIDLLPTPSVDILDDISTLKKIPKEFAEEIYACHVLEHFSHDEVTEVLKVWHRILKKGGKIHISVPDLDRIVKIYSKNWNHFQTPGNTPWIGLIYGGQKDKYDFHKTGFNFCWMKYLLERAGFKNIVEYPHAPHFILGATDASLAKEPFGEYLSLNVVAEKL